MCRGFDPAGVARFPKLFHWLKRLLAECNICHHVLSIATTIPVKIRFLAGALALTLALPFASRAAVDYSDLWWNPAESGWGVGLQRQGDVIFMTLFVYGADGRNTWFVAPDVRLQGGTWSGSLYRTRGPAFSAQFNTAVDSTEAGSATIEFTDGGHGVLRYSVDGVQVTKQISRMTWREPSASGRYHGGFSSLIEQCIDVTRVGTYDFLGDMTVTHVGNAVAFSVVTGSTGLTSSCKFSGSSQQSGRLGKWQGEYSCTYVLGQDDRGEAIARTTRRGSFTLDDVAITSGGFRGRLAGTDQDCAFNGYLGGTRLP